MEQRGKKSLGTLKTIQAHEAGPPVSPRAKIEQLQMGKGPEEIFSEQDPKKREFYALLGMVIGEVWKEVQGKLEDPRIQQERFLFEESTRKPIRASRQEIERSIDAAVYLFGPCKIIFSQYRALFHDALEAWVSRVSKEGEPIQSVRVYRRLETLLGERVQAVQSAETLTEEVMAGLGTSGRVMTFVVSSIPDVFRAQYNRAPTRDEWLMIARNSEKFILTVASKNLQKFIQMGHIFQRASYSVKTSSGGIWNEQLFCIEGEGEARSLGVQEGPLATLLTVRDMHEHNAKQTERIGCPALYVDGIGPLYRAFLRDVEVYLSPSYERLTKKKGTGYYD